MLGLDQLSIFYSFGSPETLTSIYVHRISDFAYGTGPVEVHQLNPGSAIFLHHNVRVANVFMDAAVLMKIVDFRGNFRYDRRKEQDITEDNYNRPQSSA
jgi:hypothetical protein